MYLEMNKQTNLPTPAESRGHYSVPEGYFDSLEERIMAKIPEETPEEVAEVPRISLWTRLRPIAYLAAMFVAMNLIFRAFAPKTAEDKSVATAQTEVSSEDEYANYYADYGERMTAVAGYDSYYNSLLSDLGTMTNTSFTTTR